MLFIEGVGYVNEQTPVTGNFGVSQTSQTTGNEFNKILEQETANFSNQPQTKSLEAIFKEASETYGISEDLLKAVAYNESRFQPDVTSSAGAMGIMQLMPGTASAMGVEDAYDPYQNIMGGAKLLSQLSDMYDGNTSLMLAAYAAGTGTVAKYGGVPPLDSVNNYISKIYSTMESGIAQNVPDVSYNVDGSQAYAAASNTENTANNSSNQSTKANSNPFANSMLGGGTPLAKTGETATTNIYDYRSSNTMNNLLSYSEYDILISFYENMLDIIANMGGSDNSDDDSLSSYLYNNLTYTKNNINLLSADSQNILKNNRIEL
ncbi:MAG: lytic transglycosylase domain-containing protein [Lachnospiraceae bacterium]|nr:lytic transglycosylase domain-containing protein [Lachnospiraceae bacterium]